MCFLIRLTPFACFLCEDNFGDTLRCLVLAGVRLFSKVETDFSEDELSLSAVPPVLFSFNFSSSCSLRLRANAFIAALCCLIFNDADRWAVMSNEINVEFGMGSSFKYEGGVAAPKFCLVRYLLLDITDLATKPSGVPAWIEAAVV